MQLTLRLNPKGLRRWHVALAETLARRPGTQVSVEWNPGGASLPAAVPLLFALERLVYGLPADDTRSAEPVEFARFGATSEQPDLVLDFTPGIPNSDTAGGPRTWRVAFDGVADEAAALAALMQSRTPVVALRDGATGAVVVSGHPGTETAGIVRLAYRDLLARTRMLIVAALDGGAARIDAHAQASPLDTSMVARFAAKSLARAAVRRLYLLCYNAPHWRVGWRFVDGADVIDLRAHPESGWRLGLRGLGVDNLS